MQALQQGGIEAREYQRAIAKSALTANTLVVLPTGLGKTIVAMLVATDRLSVYPQSKILTLAPTRPLVLQHAQFFKEHFQDREAKSIVLTGETRTEADEDVTPYVKDVSLNYERLTLPEKYKEVSKILRTALDERISKLRTMHQLPANVRITKRILLDLGEKLHNSLRRGGGGALFGAVQLQAQAMSLNHAIDLLETQGSQSADRFLSKLDRASTRSARGLARDPRVVEAQKLSASLSTILHPKQKRLRELISTDVQSNPDSKVIVFTQFRDSVEAIVEDLATIETVRPVRFVGQASRNSEDPGLTQGEQMQILEDFRDGKHNVLVTTSIGEEGLHVPDVDHVR